MNISGDSHRFGKRVSFEAGAQWVTKPRSVAIEFLFLDPSSPLKPYQSFLGLPFQTQIKELSAWSGECENMTPIVATNSFIETHQKKYFELAGKFLATATFFGLNDLHFENVLFLNINNSPAIVPVDLEIIYYKFITAAETALFPSPKADEQECGYTRLVPFLNAENVTLMCDAFISSWKKLSEEPDVLFGIVDAHLQKAPVRMIFRKSQTYQDLLTKKITGLAAGEFPLTKEEQAQLDAGDIPYFFSEAGSVNSISFFEAENEIRETTALNTHPFFLRHLSGKSAVSDKSSRDKLFYTGLSHTLVSLLKRLPNRPLELLGNHFSLKLADSDATLSIDGYQIKIIF